MSNSTLATVKQMNHKNYTVISDRKIDKIILHHAAAVYSNAQVGLNYFSSADCKKRQVSCHYVIGNDGSIGQSTDEKYRAWTSGSLNADKNSVTIEVSNADKTYTTISDKAMNSLIKLVADIAKRNNLGTLVKGKNVYGHKDFQATACPCYYNKIADICTKANAINNNKTTTTTTTTTTAKEVYRIRKSWKDADSQIGAYSNLTNAKKACKEGYSVFNSKGVAVYTVATKKKSVTEIAKEVIAGKWGNGDTRKKKLEAAGYNYEEVQKAVNKLLK